MPDQNERAHPEYPSDLKGIEDNLLRIRRGLSGNDAITNTIGFGLSGGGIRSATFCLGIFQGLAKQRLPQAQASDPPRTLLSKIDYLSTVSGGGFFGAFYGRLFTRKEVTEFADVADILMDRAASQEERGAARQPAEQQTEPKLPRGKVFRWLRENGRYLAPNGAGDLLLAGATVMRNLIAVQLVLATFVLMIFLAAQLIRGVVEVIAAPGGGDAGCFGRLWSSYQGLLVHVLPWGEDAVWWSPYALLPAAVFLFLAVPPGWSYWLVEKPNRDTAGHWIPPVWGLFAVIGFSLAGAIFGVCFGHKPLLFASLLFLLLAFETLAWALLSGWRPTFVKRPDSTDATDDGVFVNEDLRLRLSIRLKDALVVTGALLAFVVVDSLAQTAYAAALLGQLHVKLWAAAAFAPIKSLGGFARGIFTALGDKADGKRFAVPLTLAAGIAAVVIAALLMVALDVASYAIAWKVGMPTGPRPDWTINQKLTEAEQLAVTPEKQGGWMVTPQKAASRRPAPGSGLRRSLGDLMAPAFAFAIALVMSILFGWSWPFLNRSSPIYTSRLIRAYLGASNPTRLKPPGTSVTQAIRGDDVSQEGYWPRHRWLKPKASRTSIEEAEKEFFGKGAPTINETLDAQSQVEQHDRKGIGMAVGPAAISVGVFDHLVLVGSRSESPLETPFRVYPDADSGAYRIFRYRGEFKGEFLSLGNWTGISGAAFSTSRTSPGFRLLAGLANARFGYWWNSGVEPLDLLREKRSMAALVAKLVSPIAPALYRRLASHGEIASLPEDPKTRLQRWSSALFQLLFGVQTFLFDELLARFHGTARQWWPLSDGGHFENTGGYELIRRRLQLIVIIDSEADPDYTFEGLANLVRKARLDFGAEIRFFSEDELNVRVHSGVRKYFGTLEQLSLSLAHAALAEVIYNDEPPTDGSPPATKHLLLYIKPTLIGDEPGDVRRYHTAHPSFPNETTAQQFFDEAQWESYRRLGEHIADKVFRSQDDNKNLLAPEADRFFPYMLET